MVGGDELGLRAAHLEALHGDVVAQEDAVDPKQFFDGSMSEAVQSLAAGVMVDRYEPSQNWQLKQNIAVPRKNEDPHKAAISAMTILKMERVREAIAKQKEKMYHATQNGGDLRELQSEMMALHDLRKQIEQHAFLEWSAS